MVENDGSGWLVLVLGALLACNNGKQDSQHQQAVTSATPAVSSAPMGEPAQEWKPGPDVVALKTIIIGMARATNIDKSGATLVISDYEVPGWSLAQHAVFKDNPKAWSIHLEGDVCDIKTLAPTVEPVGDAGRAGPMRPTWYTIRGGALDGLVVKAFEAQKPCIAHIATKEYVVAKNWDFPG